MPRRIYEISSLLATAAAPSDAIPVISELASLAQIALDNDTTQLLTLEVRKKAILDAQYALSDLKRASGGRPSSLVSFLAARELVDLLPGDPFDPDLDLPDCGKALLQETGEKLYDYGKPQFDVVSSTVGSIVDWLRAQRFHRPLLLESPLGNVVPTQVLFDRLAGLGLAPITARVMAPREDKRNMLKFREFVSELQAGKYGAVSCVVYVDDVQSSSRYKKAFETLSKRLRQIEVPFLATALVFHELETLSDAQKPLWKSLRRKLITARETRGEDSPPTWVKMPACPVVPGAQGLLTISSSPVWGDDDLVSGLRKVTFIFHLIEQYQHILKELTKQHSTSRALLHWAARQGLWGHNFDFDDTMARRTYSELNDLVDWTLIENRAEEAFEEDFEGTANPFTEVGLEARGEWLREQLQEAASSHAMDGIANVLIGSLEVLYAMPPRQLLRKSAQEARYCHAALEYNDSFRTLNVTLRKRILATARP